MTRVLVAGDEHTGTLATVRALRAGGYVPYLAVSQPRTYAERSRATEETVRVPAPESDPDAFLAALAAAAVGFGVRAVLPASEASVQALAGRGSDWPAGVVAGLPDAGAVARATSKAELARAAGEAGIRTPPTVEAARDEVAARAAEAGFPVIVKPLQSVVRGEGGTLLTTEIVRARDAGALARALADRPGERFLVQPFLEGALYAVAGVQWGGRLVCSAHQRTIRTWPVDAGGSSYAVTVDRDAVLDARVERLLAALGYDGVFQLQFMLSRGEHFAIDLNPRPYGSLGLVVHAGLNLPSVWADVLLGREPRPTPARAGVRYRVEEDDLRAIVALRDWRGLLPRRRTKHAVFAWDDPAPLALTLAKLVSRARASRGRG